MSDETRDQGDRSTDGLNREQTRSRRKRLVRARTVSMKRETKQNRELQRAIYGEADEIRIPATRGDCASVPRPCPYVACPYHLYLDVNPKTGAIKLNYPDLEVWELSQSCVLDIADRGNVTLEETGAHMNITRERVRQIEEKAIRKVRATGFLTADGVSPDAPPLRPRVLLPVYQPPPPPKDLPMHATHASAPTPRAVDAFVPIDDAHDVPAAVPEPPGAPGPLPGESAESAAWRAEKARAPRYRTITISLYDADLDRLDKMVAELRVRGFARANRSGLLRSLIEQADIDVIVNAQNRKGG